MGQATRLLSAATRLRQEMGTPVRPADRPGGEGVRAAARATLGETAFADAWAAGQRLAVEEIVAQGTAGPDDMVLVTE